MSRRIAQECVRCCGRTRLLGRECVWGMFLLAAILAQPLRGEPFGETTGPVSTGNVDANLPYAAVTPENRLGECAGTCCPTCVAGNTSKGCRYFFADALFWTVREGYDENWAQVITPKGDWGSYVGTATLVDAPFDWRTGFRVGAGLRRDDGFDATLYYTNFSTSAASQASGEVYSSFMGNFYVGNSDGSISARITDMAAFSGTSIITRSTWRSAGITR